MRSSCLGMQHAVAGRTHTLQPVVITHTHASSYSCATGVQIETKYRCNWLTGARSVCCTCSVGQSGSTGTSRAKRFAAKQQFQQSPDATTGYRRFRKSTTTQSPSTSEDNSATDGFPPPIRRRCRSRSSSSSSKKVTGLESQPQQQDLQQPLTTTPGSLQQQQLAATIPAQQVQDIQPPNIQYTLNKSVSSYTDTVSCDVRVHADSMPQKDSSANNGNGKDWRQSSTGRCTPGAIGSTSRDEAVHGLIYGAMVRFSDSAALRLRRRAMVVWEQAGPKRVLIVKKPVPAAAAQLEEMATWLEQQGLQVLVERPVHEQEFPQFLPFDAATTDVDFAITLGGDGTVLHLASLFEGDVPLPPVMCFAMGTLGFLTPFDASQYRSCLKRVLAANRQPLYCTLRTRKRCAVMNSLGEVLRVYHILNECVVDRGAFPSSVYLEIYIDGGFVTAAEADGLIVATPSGSTAYSMSAGGAMVAPSVPCTLLTPLSPHSLSFRPLIIPENADLLIRLPPNARSHARVSFDGKHPMRLERGGSVHFQTSLCPLPLINIGVLDTDWYEGITQKLKWNQSIRGGQAVVPEPGDAWPKQQQKSHSNGGRLVHTGGSGNGGNGSKRSKYETTSCTAWEIT